MLLFLRYLPARPLASSHDSWIIKHIPCNALIKSFIFLDSYLLEHSNREKPNAFRLIIAKHGFVADEFPANEQCNLPMSLESIQTLLEYRELMKYS